MKTKVKNGKASNQKSRLKMVKKYLITYALLFINTFVYSQTDTEFWFVAPDITSGHADRPIILRIATTEANEVKISQPANPNFPKIEFTMPANGTTTIDLTPYIDMVENFPPDAILNKGIHILAKNDITVYYEINTTNNPDIFSLKGRNALGREFYIPAQNYWSNHNSYNPLPYSGFDIVATEDSTVVEITPRQNIVGHAANVPFTIVLNKGQTYSARAASQAANRHLAGSKVVSNKPIAITVYDDSAWNSNYGGCKDVMGDQLIPIDVIGYEYIIMKGFLGNPAGSRPDKIFITATKNNTQIFIGGNYVTTLNERQLFAYDVTVPSLYVRATEPIYMLHVTGFGCEVGQAVLPAIKCTGSYEIAFTRSSPEFCGIILMVRRGNEGKFLLNGDPSIITASNFSPVPGTNGEWMAASIPLNVAVGVTHFIKNTGDRFHMGLVNGGSVTGCRYGYFSSYRALKVDLPKPHICYRDTAKLIAKVNMDSVTYLWYSGATENFVVVCPEVTSSYTVTVTSYDGCRVVGETKVYVHPYPEVTINASSTSIYLGDTAILEAFSNLEDSYFVWSTGDSTPRILATPIENTTYALTVSSSYGCKKISTMDIVVLNSGLPIELIDAQVVCGEKEVILTWQTASEKNNDYFTIETSNNYYEWKTNSVVPGAGNSNTVKTYKHQLANANNQAFYIRLSQTDYNGVKKVLYTTYANCKLNSNNSTNFWISDNYLNLSIESKETQQAKIVIFDNSGRILQTSYYPVYEGKNFIQHNLANLSSNAIIVKVILNDEYFSKKVVYCY